MDDIPDPHEQVPDPYVQNLVPYPIVPEDHDSLGSQAERAEAEVARIRRSQILPDVPEDLSAEIWRRLPVKDDYEEWKRIAERSQNNWTLAGLLLDLELLDHMQSHPTRNASKDESMYERRRLTITSQIEKLEEILEQQRNH